MDTTTISPSLPPPVTRVPALAAIRRVAGRWGLIAALAALPVYFGVMIWCSATRRRWQAIR